MELQEVQESTQTAPGVVFDAERMAVQGIYTDQLAAYRARKLWTSALQKNFLLEAGHDFSLEVKSDLDASRFTLRCDFLTACGRYAFWRLTHSQAPEVQYMMEIAHVPQPLTLEMKQVSENPYQYRGDRVKGVLTNIWKFIRRRIQN